MDIVEFNKRCMLKYNIVEEIQKLIYDHKIPNKFVFNDYTQKSQINPKMLYRTNSFISLKNLVYRSADLKNGMIDITLLKSFLELGEFKCKIFQSCQKYGLRIKYESVGQIRNQQSSEMRTSKLNEIEQELIDDS